MEVINSVDDLGGKKMKMIKKWFIAGSIVTIPLAVTLWLVWSTVAWLDDLASSIIPKGWHPSSYLPVEIPGTGLVIIVSFILVSGFVAAGWLGRRADNLSQAVLGRLPVIRIIYRTVRKITETALGRSGSSFRVPVLIEFPYPDAWCVGFIAGESAPEIQSAVKERTVSVFVPTAPNPTSGFLINIRRERLRTIDMSAEEALRNIVSVGLVRRNDETKEPGND